MTDKPLTWNEWIMANINPPVRPTGLLPGMEAKPEAVAVFAGAKPHETKITSDAAGLMIDGVRLKPGWGLRWTGVAWEYIRPAGTAFDAPVLQNAPYMSYAEHQDTLMRAGRYQASLGLNGPLLGQPNPNAGIAGTGGVGLSVIDYGRQYQRPGDAEDEG